jgi:hypothetical protein
MNEPRDIVQRLDEKPPLPKGDGELLFGYGVMSCHASRQIAPDAGISEPHKTLLRARKPDTQISIESQSVA